MIHSLAQHGAELYVPYGIAFLIMGVVILASPRDDDLPGALTDAKLLAAFGLLHGLLELWVGWTLVHELDERQRWVTPFLLALSYLPLLEFTRRSVRRQGYPAPGRWIYLPVAALLAALAAAAADPADGLAAASRLLLGLPGAMGCGLVLLLAVREAGQILNLLAQRATLAAGIGFLLYGALTGLVVEAGAGWSPPLPTPADFSALYGVPVQVPRTLIALLLAACFALLLRELSRDARRRRHDALQLARTTTAELERLIQDRTQALTLSEDRLQRAQQVARVGSWYHHLGDRVLTYSDETYRIFGLEPGSEASEDRFLELVHPDDRDMFDAAWKAALKQGTFSVEFRILVDGEQKWLRSIAEFEQDESGWATEAIGTVQDITELKETTLALESSEATYRLLVQNQTDLVVKVDAKGRFEFVSPTYCETFGRSEESLLGQEFMPLVHEEDRESTAKAMKALAHPPYTCYLEQRAMTSRGWRWFGWADKAIVDEHDNIVSVVGVGRDITERKQAEEQLLETRALLRAVIDATPDWIFAKDREYRFLLANRAFAASQNVAPAEMIGRRDEDFRSEHLRAGDPEKGLAGVHHDDDRALAGTPVHNPHDPATVADGSERIFDTLKLPLRSPEGEIYGVLAYARDVTERHVTTKQLEQTVRDLADAQQRQRDLLALAQREQGRMSALLSAMSTGILFEDRDGAVEYVNPSFRKMWGIEPSVNLVGESTRSVLERSSSQFARANHASRHVLHVLDTHEVSERFEIELLDGRILTQLSFPVEDPDGRTLGRLWIYEDITHERQTAQQLIYLAERDPLTGLYNRHRFQERLGEMLKSAHRAKTRFALLYFDLDEFKQINDNFGHRAGDSVLVRTAGEIATLVRSTELFARLGGDEFAVLINITKPGEAGALASRIVNAVAGLPFRFRGINIRVTTSVGVATFPDHGAGTEALVVHADAAMYQAKARGKNTWALFDPEAQPSPVINQRTAWSERIDRALASDEVVVHYQGVYHSSDGSLSHLEALARIRDPTLPDRIIMPGQFVPVAERTGQVVDLDRRVLRQVVAKLAANPRMPPVAVNISGRSFDEPDLPQYIRSLLTEHGVPPSRLLVELTETAAVSDIQDAQRFIEALKRLGCRVCLDDFGAGFSSFAYLKYVDADILKIDGLFIRDLPNNRDTQVFVRAMVDVARGLDMISVAEGVESQRVLEMVTDLGVSLAQGYHLDRPQEDHPALER